MSKKIIPLTTELAVRSHARAMFLKALHEALSEKHAEQEFLNEFRFITDPLRDAGEYIQDALFAVLPSPTEDLGDISARQIGDAMMGQFALVTLTDESYGIRQAIDFLDKSITFPVSSGDFSQVYSFWYNVISKDNEELEMTKWLLGLYADRNQNMGEFLMDTVNPADPLNWVIMGLMWACPPAALAAIGAKAAGIFSKKAGVDIIINAAAKQADDVGKAGADAVKAAVEAGPTALQKSGLEKAKEIGTKAVADGDDALRAGAEAANKTMGARVQAFFGIGGKDLGFDPEAIMLALKASGVENTGRFLKDSQDLLIEAIKKMDASKFSKTQTVEEFTEALKKEVIEQLRNIDGGAVYRNVKQSDLEGLVSRLVGLEDVGYSLSRIHALKSGMQVSLVKGTLAAMGARFTKWVTEKGVGKGRFKNITNSARQKRAMINALDNAGKDNLSPQVFIDLGLSPAQADVLVGKINEGKELARDFSLDIDELIKKAQKRAQKRRSAGNTAEAAFNSAENVNQAKTYIKAIFEEIAEESPELGKLFKVDAGMNSEILDDIAEAIATRDLEKLEKMLQAENFFAPELLSPSIDMEVVLANMESPIKKFKDSIMQLGRYQIDEITVDVAVEGVDNVLGEAIESLGRRASGTINRINSLSPEKVKDLRGKLQQIAVRPDADTPVSTAARLQRLIDAGLIDPDDDLVTAIRSVGDEIEFGKKFFAAASEGRPVPIIGADFELLSKEAFEERLKDANDILDVLYESALAQADQLSEIDDVLEILGREAPDLFADAAELSAEEIRLVAEFAEDAIGEMTVNASIPGVAVQQAKQAVVEMFALPGRGPGIMKRLPFNNMYEFYRTYMQFAMNISIASAAGVNQATMSGAIAATATSATAMRAYIQNYESFPEAAENLEDMVSVDIENMEGASGLLEIQNKINDEIVSLGKGFVNLNKKVNIVGQGGDEELVEIPTGAEAEAVYDKDALKGEILKAYGALGAEGELTTAGAQGFFEHWDEWNKSWTHLIQTGTWDRLIRLAKTISRKGLRAETARDIGKINFIDLFGIATFAGDKRDAFGFPDLLSPSALDALVNQLANTLRGIAYESLDQQAAIAKLQIGSGQVVPAGLQGYWKDSDSRKIQSGIKDFASKPMISKINFPKFHKSLDAISNSDATTYTQKKVDKLKKGEAYAKESEGVTVPINLSVPNLGDSKKPAEEKVDENFSKNKLIDERALRRIIRESISGEFKKKRRILSEKKEDKEITSIETLEDFERYSNLYKTTYQLGSLKTDFFDIKKDTTHIMNVRKVKPGADFSTKKSLKSKAGAFWLKALSTIRWWKATEFLTGGVGTPDVDIEILDPIKVKLAVIVADSRPGKDQFYVHDVKTIYGPGSASNITAGSELIDFAKDTNGGACLQAFLKSTAQYGDENDNKKIDTGEKRSDNLYLVIDSKKGKRENVTKVDPNDTSIQKTGTVLYGSNTMHMGPNTATAIAAALKSGHGVKGEEDLNKTLKSIDVNKIRKIKNDFKATDVLGVIYVTDASDQNAKFDFDASKGEVVDALQQVLYSNTRENIFFSENLTYLTDAVWVEEVRKRAVFRNLNANFYAFSMIAHQSDYVLPDSKATFKKFFDDMKGHKLNDAEKIDIEEEKANEKTDDEDGSAEDSAKKEEIKAKARERFKTFAQKEGILVPQSPTARQAAVNGNQFIETKGMAAYIYRRGLDTEVKTRAPSFYDGMYRPGDTDPMNKYAEDSLVKVSAHQDSDWSVDEYNTLRKIIIQDAIAGGQGIFGNKKYKSAKSLSGQAGGNWKKDDGEGFGQKLGKVHPDLKVYDPDYVDPEAYFSTALFFRDLANNLKKPSMEWRGMEASGHRPYDSDVYSSDGGAVDADVVVVTDERHPPVEVKGSRIMPTGAGDISEFLRLTYLSQAKFEEILTKSAPTASVYSARTASSIKITINKDYQVGARLSSGISVTDRKSMEKLLGSRRVDYWLNNVKSTLNAHLKARIRKEENLYKSTSTDVGESIADSVKKRHEQGRADAVGTYLIPLINSSTMGRAIREGKKPRGKKLINVSRAFKRRK